MNNPNNKRTWFPILAVVSAILVPLSQAVESELNKTESLKIEAATVKAACGQCLWRMKGEGCTLAVEIDGNLYFVEGTGIDDHGDAHAADGFCNAVKIAKVSGRIKDGKFFAESFTVDKTGKK